MNRSETAAVIAYLNRAGLVGALEGQTVVWAEALADLDVADVQPAVREIVRTRTSAERWVTPGDVRAATMAREVPKIGTPEFKALPTERQIKILEREEIREFNR